MLAVLATLCAHSTLLHYVARTASIRQSLNSSQVFVSYGKPYKVISSATLARWLKAVLSLAGIDTSIFKSESFRGASTSKAVSLGIPLDVILKAADWKNAGAFCQVLSKTNIFCWPICPGCSYTVVFQIDAVSLSHE